MKQFAMDLHIHSTLSPCGGREMTPPNVIQQAKAAGLEGIVIADHNSAENQEAFLECGKRMGIKIIPGIEVQSREDVHVICIFDTLEQVLAWQEIVYANMPCLENKEDIFGMQEIVDWQGQKIGDCKRFLLTATNISIDNILKQVMDLGGLALPAHIDRPSFSLWSHLGFFTDDFNFLGVELTPHLTRIHAQLDFIKRKGLGVIVSSDAHHLSQIQKPYTWGYIKEFSVKELILALKGEEGRHLTYARGVDPFKILD